MYSKERNICMNKSASNYDDNFSAKEPMHLTKEEMRKKIKASLAAKTYQQEEHNVLENEEAAVKPTHISSHSEPPSKKTQNPTSNQTPAVNSKGAAAYSRSSKVRQIREAVASHRNDGANAPYASVKENTQQQKNDTVRQSSKKQSSVATAVKPTTVTMPHSFVNHASAIPQNKKKVTRVWIILGIVIAAILMLTYLSGILIFHSKFLPNTYVNNINIGGMTMEEADKAVLSNANEMGVTFIPKSGDPIVFKGSSFGCTIALADNALEEPASENHALWFFKFFSKSEYTAKYEDSYSEDALSSLIAAYDWGNIPPTDAKVIENEDGSFSIQPEDDGNMVDTKVLSDYTIAQMREGNNTIQMADSNCYKKAAVTAKSLEGQLALYNQIGAVEITYDMTDREEILDPVGTERLDHTTIMEWISTDSGQITVNRDKATEWVQKNIADKYDTLVTGYTRTFQSTMDGKIELPIGEDGIYGWKTNVSATVDNLIDYIQNGESVTVEPIYKVEGFRMNSNSGVTYTGNTYIEIDICNQKLWYYVNGELYLESDVVTGTQTDPSRATPPGAYKVWSRESPRKLGTYEVQGYETWVNYWMPVTYTGIGLHDLSRSAYGGDIYMTNGSHGCINLPLDIAKQIYDKVTINTPVLIIP